MASHLLIVEDTNTIFSGGREQQDQQFKSLQGELFLSSDLKNTQHKNRADSVAQVVQCLHTKHEALSSNHSITKN
jgi:hypothetical protein